MACPVTLFVYLLAGYFVIRINVIPPMLLDVGGNCIVIERGARSCPRRLRLRRRAETRNLLGIARDIRANTLVSLSRANPRTPRLVQPFKGSRSKVSPSLFRTLLFEVNLQTDLQIEMKFKSICDWVGKEIFSSIFMYPLYFYVGK